MEGGGSGASWRRTALWIAQVAGASTLLIFAHWLSGPAKAHGVDGPSFVLWRFVVGGAVAACALLIVALIAPYAPATRAKWTSTGDELGRFPDGWGVVIVALSAIGFVASMALQIDGTTRYGITAMNVPVAGATVLLTLFVARFVHGQPLSTGQVIGAACLLAGLVLVFASSPDTRAVAQKTVDAV